MTHEDYIVIDALLDGIRTNIGRGTVRDYEMALERLEIIRGLLPKQETHDIGETC